MPKPISVLICMRDRLARDGISQILKSENYRIRASVASIELLLSINISSDTEYIVLYSGNHKNQVFDEDIQAIKNKFPRSHVVLLLENCLHEQRWQVERIGASGVLLQSISSQVFIASLRLVALGEHVFSVPISIDSDERSTVLVERSTTLNGKIVLLPERDDDVRVHPKGDHFLPSPPSTPPSIARRTELSERELEILSCLVAGNSNKVIARLCNITEATVKAHLKAILRKTEVVNRTQAAVWALNNINLNGRHPEAEVDGSLINSCRPSEMPMQS